MKQEMLNGLKERRSVRAYEPRQIADEELDIILEAGTYAPTGQGLQSPVIVVVQEPGLRNRLARMNAAVMGREGDPFYGAPTVLIVLADKKRHTYLEDGSLVLGNLMNAAYAVGLGSCWIHRAKEEFEQPEYKALLASLGIQGEWEGVGHCAVGYIDGEPPKAAKRKDGRVFWAE